MHVLTGKVSLSQAFQKRLFCHHQTRTKGPAQVCCLRETNIKLREGAGRRLVEERFFSEENVGREKQGRLQTVP